MLNIATHGTFWWPRLVDPALARATMVGRNEGGRSVDWWLIALRIVHIGSAMSWFGGALIGSFFLEPTARALGDNGQAFWEHLMRTRRMEIFYPIVAALTVLSGATLYWRDSGGLEWTWVSSPPGLAYTIGGLAAIMALVTGIILIGPSTGEQAAVQAELAASAGAPTEQQRLRLARAEGRIRLATRLNLGLILLAALMMAVGRYV
jgi:uncharacterized membrane protein